MASRTWHIERGRRGQLHFVTRPIKAFQGTRVEHVLAYTYLGDWQGMRCFADDDGDRIYLHPDEIISFLEPLDALGAGL